MPRGVTLRDVEREVARARGARRLLPWAVATAAGGGLIPLFAGGGWRAALTLAALGLSFAFFLWVTSIARCPACGAPLGKGPAPRGPARAAGGERPESCPRCRTRFE